jgi:hypothetical protein
MWSDGRWNKLTMAQCCWKCTFCDIWITSKSMNLLPLVYSVIEWKMMSANRENGFHYVDEAAPPALMRAGTRDPQEKIIRDVVDEHSIRKSFSETCAC